mmetsp:Transcript_29602/g.28820  ORF Transcript_29602/g.28820 Transcript_29602/m.28820 type:complete len:218 (-) Transcript_29602:24-677(-)
MAACMKGGGKRTRPMERAASSMLMETSMMGSGRMIKPTVTGSTRTWMVLGMMVTGRKTSSMEKAWKLGPMELATEATMWKGRSTATAASPGQTAAPTPESSTKIILREEVCTSGPMGGTMRASGRTIKWREKESSPGQMAGGTKASTWMIKRKAKASSTGLTGGNMMESGTMESNMEWGFTLRPLGRPSRASGMKGRESGGSADIHNVNLNRINWLL